MNEKVSGIQVLVGTCVTGTSGQKQDNTRSVLFRATQLAQVIEHDYDTEKDALSDTRGITSTLYRTDDDRLVVHVKDWSNWVNEHTTHTIAEITLADLALGGPYERLGQEGGFGRPLTLEEALAL